MVGNELRMKRNVKFGGKQEYYGEDTKHKDGNWGEETEEGAHRGRYPTDTMEFPIRKGRGGAGTRSEEMVEYIVKTYSNEGQSVLDITCYDAITGHVCKRLGRKYVGIDLNPTSYEGKELINEESSQESKVESSQSNQGLDDSDDDDA